MTASSDVTAIREWLVKQPHLPQSLDDKLLGRFLESCEGSLERTKTSMDLFFTLRNDCPEVFRNRDPMKSCVQDVFNLIDLCPLQKLTPEGYNCFLLRFADNDPDKFNFTDVLKLFFMVGDLQIRSETDFVQGGLVPILDMTGWSLRHVTKIPLSPLKKYMQYCQEGLPVRLKQIHIINAFPLLDKLLALVRPLMNREVASMIHTHPVGSEAFYKFIPKDILPEEYGGNGGMIKDIKDSWKKKLEEEKEWFLKDEWMSDESKRIGKRSAVQEGSFRSLSFD